MLRDEEWREVDSIIYKEGKVYVPKDEKLRAEIIRLHYCHDLANWLSHYLYFFSFLIYNYKMERGKVSCDFITMSKWYDGGHRCHSHSVSHDESNMRTMGEQAHSHSSKVYK